MNATARNATHTQISGPNGLAANLTPFTGANLKGVTGAHHGVGMMPEPTATQYRDARDTDRIAYTLVSYATPIAWVLTDGTVIDPGHGYSNTTKRHRTLSLPWLGQAAALTAYATAA